MSDTRPDDDKPQPQVIDLDATDFKAEDDTPRPVIADDEDSPLEVENVEPTSPPPHMHSDKRPPKKSGMWRWVAVAVFAGAIVGGWIYRDLLANYFPTAQVTAMQTRLDVLEANGKTVGEQLLSVSQAADAAKAAAAATDGAIKSTAGSLAEVNSRLVTQQSRITAVETALKSARTDLDGLTKAIAAVGTTPTGNTSTGPVDPAALAALNQRIATLEADVASLKQSPGGDRAALTAALSQTLADLKAKVAAGASFQAEYDSIARLVPAAAGLDVLAAHAAEGIAAPAGLASALRDVSPSLPQPVALAPASDSWTGWLLESLSGFVTIRDIGEADWPQLAAKAAALAESGDLTQAIAVIDAAEGTLPVPLSQWRDRAAARLALESAVGQVSESVMRQIAAQGGVQ